VALGFNLAARKPGGAIEAARHAAGHSECLPGAGQAEDVLDGEGGAALGENGIDADGGFGAPEVVTGVMEGWNVGRMDELRRPNVE